MARSLLLVALLLAWAPAQAQDPREIEVQNAARQWLALTDKLDAEGAWKAAGEKFRNNISAADWAKALPTYREPFGAVQQRAAISTSFRNDLPGAPDGQYALLQFRTAFAKKSEGHESVTLELESDGKWRVIGYFIR
ncbi:MAG TPA: DUF4019 domain-containing protein [Casimicrobiaceae bacterium]|nr:DUF4019 domain-containing protein [Casimicrobiaceae bacterium]